MTEDNNKYDRLGLGTVQFGLDYGISNRAGRTPLDEATKILETAAEYGIGVLDTAYLYGDSERVLGEVLPPGHDFEIVTKTPAFEGEVISEEDARRLEASFEESLERMGVESVYGLLIHHFDDLTRPGSDLLYNALRRIKDSGRTKKIGVSLYTGDQIDILLDRFDLDMVQLPINVFDQRLVSGGYLTRLKAAGMEIHARSIFLQGLLVMAPEEVPDHMRFARPVLEDFRRRCERGGGDPMSAALNFARDITELDCIIIGVNDCRQLRANLRAWDRRLEIDFRDLAVKDERIITPSIWRRLLCRN